MSTNHLGSASSSYLRSASHQPIAWYEWGTEAFEAAKAQDKPILLDIGAVWCHWCHVMDRESYENDATAALINENFIAIKVDRDERPDIDTRYQAAVSAISGQGGWPLTGFLTPDGRPYFGGTYFPPEDRYGRPSFQRVLQTMANAWQERRDEVNETAGSVMHAIEYNESFSGRSGDLSDVLVDKLVQSMLSQFDPQFGGFGSQPKFPHPAALDLLIDVSTRGGTLAEKCHQASLLTLQKMARGGMRDHLGGGFHRYSVDERWAVPHFEKMAYDNGTLLSTYIHGFQTFVDRELAEAAQETVRFMDEVLSDREHGGFYGSQDADLNLDDDGDYFTWTRSEAAAALTAEELAVAALWFKIDEIGDMHHDPLRNVLHIKHSAQSVAERLKLSAEQFQTLLNSATGKLRAARNARPTPFVDKALYTGWNGLCISGYLQAGRVLLDSSATAFALQSLDRVLDQAWSDSNGLSHIVAADSSVPAVLDDYAYLTLACVDAWEATGNPRYLHTAVALVDYVLPRLHDKTGGGFFDTAADAAALGALTARRKPLQDSPTPSGNAAMTLALLRLSHWTANQSYREIAIDTLETFAGIVEHFGLYAATFGLALVTALAQPVQVVIVGDDDLARDLENTAMTRYAVNKSVLRIRREEASHLPASLAETIPFLPGNTSVALVCTDGTCQPPVSDPYKLDELLNSLV